MWVRWLIVSLGLAALYLSPLLFSVKTLYLRDLSNLFWPYRTYAAESLQRGLFPFWNPYAFTGQPFLANPEASLLYPLSLPFYLFEFVAGYKIQMLLHLWLAGFFMILLGKRLRAGGFWALWGSIIFAFSGYMATRLEFPSILGSAIFLPILVLFLLGRSFWFLGLGLSLPFLSGHPQVLFYSGILLLIFSTGKMERFKRLLQGGGLFLIVSSAQMLPFVEFAADSNRAHGLSYEQATSVSFAFTEFMRLVLPEAFGKLAFGGSEGAFWLRTLFIGWVGALGALFPLFFGPSKRWRMALLTFGVLLMGRHTPVYFLLYEHLSPFRFIRYPAAAGFCLIFLLGSLLYHYGEKWRWKGWVCGLTLLGSLLPLARFSWKVNPTLHKDFFHIRTPTIHFLQSHLGKRRFLVLEDAFQSSPQTATSLKDLLPTNFSMPYHLHNLSGYDPLTTQEASRMERLAQAARPQSAGFLKQMTELHVAYLLTVQNLPRPWRKVHTSLAGASLYENPLAQTPPNRPEANPTAATLLGISLSTLTLGVLLFYGIMRVHEKI